VRGIVQARSLVKGKAVVMTGGTSGIGEVAAKASIAIVVVGCWLLAEFMEYFEDRECTMHGGGALPPANDIAALLIVAAAFVFIGWAMVRLTSRKDE
jgi:NAD(P)-dependent dehydrogenase (short-subunit alcohol dehydrogenase family)